MAIRLNGWNTRSEKDPVIESYKRAAGRHTHIWQPAHYLPGDDLYSDKYICVCGCVRMDRRTGMVNQFIYREDHYYERT